MASSATSRAGSYINGTSRCRNLGDLMCPSACATSRRAETAVCRVSSASVRSACSAAVTSSSAGLSASAAAAVTTIRGSRSSRNGRITPTACSPRVAASAATAAARTSGCSSLSMRSMPADHRACTSGRAASRVRSARARTVGEAWWSSSGEIRWRLSNPSSRSIACSTCRASGWPSSSTSVSIVNRSGSAWRRSCACTSSVSRLRRKATM